MEIRIKFFGVRGSIASASSNNKKIGCNTSCVFLQGYNQNIIFDAGTGIFQLGQHISKTGKTRHYNLLLSHFHWDHILGLPFFSPINDKKIKLSIYGQAGLKNSLNRLLEPPNFPVRLKNFKSKIKLIELSKNKFKIGKINIIPFEVNHPNKALGYKLIFPNNKKIIYISDNSLIKINADLINLINGADLLIHDAQYLPSELISKIYFGHSTYLQLINLCRIAKIKSLALFHHDPARSDKEVLNIEKAAIKIAQKLGIKTKIFAAKEGISILI